MSDFHRERRNKTEREPERIWEKYFEARFGVKVELSSELFISIDHVAIQMEHWRFIEFIWKLFFETSGARTNGGETHPSIGLWLSSFLEIRGRRSA